MGVPRRRCAAGRETLAALGRPREKTARAAAPGIYAELRVATSAAAHRPFGLEAKPAGRAIGRPGEKQGPAPSGMS
jgi:hypothetical protein